MLHGIVICKLCPKFHPISRNDVMTMWWSLENLPLFFKLARFRGGETWKRSPLKIGPKAANIHKFINHTQPVCFETFGLIPTQNGRDFCHTSQSESSGETKTTRRRRQTTTPRPGGQLKQSLAHDSDQQLKIGYCRNRGVPDRSCESICAKLFG